MKIDRPSGPKPPEEQAPVADVGRKGAPALEFADALAGADGASAAGGVGTTGVEALVGRLRAGEIGVDAVLDTLVEQAVQGAPLGPQGRDTLRAMLRAALESDPTLQRLVREIEQG